jgi:predicted nucleic acid-binding protein
MSILLDTNVLVRLAQTDDRDHAATKSVVVSLGKAGVELCVVPQVVYEFWVVATRPMSSNGLGMTTADAENSLKLLLEGFTLRLDERGIFRHWQSLVSLYDVKGKSAHDARLVAAMQRHGLTRILTYNTADFTRYPGIDVISPPDVPASRSGGPLPPGSQQR